VSGEAVLTDVRAAHRFDEERLFQWIGGRLDGLGSAPVVRQFEGGQSNPTYLIEGRERRYVLRKRPPGVLLESAHQVGREYRIMKALEGLFPFAPLGRLHCEDPEVIGSEFFIMDYIPGRIFLSAALPELQRAERRAVYESFVDTLVALHAVDPDAAGLGTGFGRNGAYYERQLSRWTRQYEAAQTSHLPEMETLMSWLRAHVPGDTDRTIVHGDYSVRNCLIHPARPQILAVLDWELSTLGDPFADLAHAFLFYFWDTPEKDIVALGIPSRAELFERYCRRSGRTPLDWTFSQAFALFRIAAINQGVYKRGLEGNAASEAFMDVVPTILGSVRSALAIIAGERV
jgi:aminoglycoside phosphotransferase (APT) family kinase protein